MQLPNNNPNSAPDSDRASGTKWKLSWMIAFGVLLVIAAVLRIRAAQNEMWLDEIWSLLNSRAVHSPLDILTKLHIDNNNYFNTLWMSVCGQQASVAIYRTPAIIAGIACVAAAGLVSWRRGKAAVVFALVLFTFSYVQILYSTEARGYSEAVLCLLLSWYFLEQFALTRRWQFAAGFCVGTICGFCSHPIFLNAYCAFALWALWRFTKSGHGIRAAIKPLLACFAIPNLFLATIYFVDLRWLIVGGGASASLAGTFAQSLAWALGTPNEMRLQMVGGVIAVGILAAATWMLRSENSDAWLFFGGVILFPIVLTILHGSDVIAVRHFLLGMSCVLVLLGWVLAAWWERGPAGKAACAFVILLFLAANGWTTATLFKYGRGQYLEAMRYLVQNTRGEEIDIGSNHDFRVSTVLKFHLDQISGDKTVNYYLVNNWPRRGPEWVIEQIESTEDPARARPNFTDANSNRYDLVKSFPSAPLTGLHWFVYHNERDSK